jgi:hypothetical protein
MGEIVVMVTYGESPAMSEMPGDWQQNMRFARLCARWTRHH